jgi:Ca2+-transporting ATPase
MVLRQFSDFMILVLLTAAIISGIIGEPRDTIAIIVIVLLNAVIGVVQEYRAERATAALRRMTAPDARVRRDGIAHTLPATELVPGDIVELVAGNVIPADLRLLETTGLQTDESALTGESHSVEKITDRLDQSDLPVGDRRNLCFKGTSVTRGTGLGLVFATGMQTELGRVADLLAKERRVRTPLQRRMARFGRYLALAVLAICVIVFVSGLVQGQPPMLMFLTAISLAVAAIPEALPAVMTVSLALGARRLSRHDCLVRNLPAVETLGSVTVICTDKTGTLTENRMSVEAFVTAGEQQVIYPESDGRRPSRALGVAMALSNDVHTAGDGEIVGEPTELALYGWANQAGFDKSALENEHPRIAEITFDSARRLMTTFHRQGAGIVAYVKGAPEVVIPCCDRALAHESPVAFAADQMLDKATGLAQQGYRVLALAERHFDSLPTPLETAERGLTLLGLVAMIDPPRPEVRQSVAECKTAGIRPVMITGDHPGTASAIAVRLGIAGDDPDVMSGRQLAELSDEEFAQKVGDVEVYARVSPDQKIRIVKALQDRGEFVAMTGDGVNDAPALKRAGIGVAMGKQGTDVARQAADMVLLDDNFATIVSAVREGRRIFDNIRKFIKYTMSSNSGEIWTLFLAPFLGLPIPLLPIHILWINLVTDGLPGLALSAEPAEPSVMERPPRHPRESVFAHGMWQHIIWVGLLVGGLSIAAQAWAIARGEAYWQTIVFTVLTLSQLFHALAVRSERESLWSLGVLGNLPMLGAVILTVGLQLAVIYVPALNLVFKTAPLPLVDLLACVAISSLVLLAVEFEKALLRRGRLYGEPASA